MRSIPSFLSLIAILCLYAVFVRLAARIVRASGVGWLRAFQFAALVVGLSVIGRVVTSYVGEAPLVVGSLFGIALHLAFGGWFFKDRALAADGLSLGWTGGTKLTAVAAGLLVLTVLVLLGVARVLLSTMQP